MRSVLILMVAALCSLAEPVVMTGAMIPKLLNRPIAAIRLINHTGRAIPFQIDERDTLGEFLCPGGTEPNMSQSNGILDSTDEIVFLIADADSENHPGPLIPGAGKLSLIRHQTEWHLWYTVDSTIPLSKRSYITYDHPTQTVTTPMYYAVFGKNRFHFVKAGIFDKTRSRMLDLTRELRIRIKLRALWGLINIAYTEDNMVCTVKRYKAGPLRLIRRGEFHLNLGLWVEGSHAAVHQICYSDMVGVPVYTKLPISLKMLFKEAYLDMAPQLQKAAFPFIFEVPRYGIAIPLAQTAGDTILNRHPDHASFCIHNGSIGFGWLLNTTIPPQFSTSSGYIISSAMRTADSTIGFAGFRISLTDLPAGTYLFSNWVYFADGGINSLKQVARHILTPMQIVTDSKKTGTNRLDCIPELQTR